MKPVLIAATFLSSSVLWVGCEPCASEEACDLGHRGARSSAVSQGIAGVSYGRSDVIRNGCKDCWFEEDELVVWRLEDGDPQTEARAEQIATDEPPEKVVPVKTQYAEALDAAHYLICTQTERKSCAFVTVGQDELWTVHINHPVKVGATLKVFDPEGVYDEATTFTLAPPQS